MKNQPETATGPETASRNGGKYILLTGATGLVGRYLLKDLCLAGCQLAVVVRPGKTLSAEERVEEIQQQWEQILGRPLARPVVLEGDVTQPFLGLDDVARKWIGEHVDHLIHNAAVLTFEGADRKCDPWLTNLNGTENVIQLCRENGVKKISYVSTAYVSGISDGTVLESDLDKGQSFRNDYERSKYEAEMAVRNADCFDCVTIFRPAVIVGDSKTGYTSTYHGLFLYLRLLHTLISNQQPNEDGVIETPISLPMSGDEPRNLIPVDWVSAVISHIVGDPDSHGRTYHLTPDRCTTARDVIEACYEFFNSTGVEYAGSSQDRTADSEFAERFFENARIYEAYETSDPQFDRTNLNQFAAHLPCPEIDRAMIIRFLEFGKSDNWGKRRSHRPDVRLWFKSHLDQVARGMSRICEMRNGDSSGCLRLGLDIRGPGGGQWQVTADHDFCEVSPGLPSQPHDLLQMDHEQVASLLNGSARSPENCEQLWETKLGKIFGIKSSIAE